jgi:hypothetical protein
VIDSRHLSRSSYFRRIEFIRRRAEFMLRHDTFWSDE